MLTKVIMAAGDHPFQDHKPELGNWVLLVVAIAGIIVVANWGRIRRRRRR